MNGWWLRAARAGRQYAPAALDRGFWAAPQLHRKAAVLMTVAFVPRSACQMMPWFLALYAVASLLHFTHNAEYLAQYPHLPASWTRADVYLAWCCTTAVGLLGYVLYRGGFLRVGLIVLAIYGGLGFDGLLHYTRAPIAHHSGAMNFTIWAEVAAAAVFLINLTRVFWSQRVVSATCDTAKCGCHDREGGP